MKIPVYLKAIIILVVTLCNQSSYSKDVAYEKKRVLMLHSVEEARPWNIMFNTSYREAIKKDSLFDIETSIEYLDLIRYNSETYKDILEKTLRFKYENFRPDIIVITQIEAVNFVFERNLFPEIPKILVEIENKNSVAYPNSTIIQQYFDFESKLKHALDIFPSTNEIYVISGNSAIDNYTLEIFNKAAEKLKDRVSFKYLIKLSSVELLDRIKNLPENSLVYFLSYTQDLDGRAIIARDFICDIDKCCNRPVFSFMDLITAGTGIFGGMVESLKSKAKKTVDVINQVLIGENIENILQSDAGSFYIYDWDELKKWNININNLPEESVIYNRKYSLWELYKKEAIGIITLLLSYTLLLILLLRSNRIKRKNEKQLIIAKEKTEENEKRYKGLINNVDIGIVVHAADTSIIISNSRAAELLGLSNDQMEGKVALGTEWKFIFENFTPLPLNDYPVMRIIDSKKAMKNQVLGVRRKPNDIVWLMVNGFPVANNKGEIIEILISFIDITERKNSELLLQEKNNRIAFQNEEYKLLNEKLLSAKRKAEESDRLKTAFLANMSHEIRTPMNSILGFAELLKEPNLSGDEQNEYIRIIEKSGARMLNTINEIIDISKIEAGQMEIDITETNINELLDFMFLFFKPEVESKGVVLSLQNNLQAQEISIKTDKEKLHSILINLIKNAVKYTKTGSIIFGYSIKTISTSSKPDKKEVLEFFVKDTGIGIPSDRQEAVFKRFIQADVLDKNAFQGSGLGLSISKAYVEMLGGQIWLKSEVEIGSTFYFTIPFNSDDSKKDHFLNQENTEIIRDQLKPESLKMKFLIVEDDETSAYYISEVLQAISRDILNATTGIEAIDYCRSNPDIDLVLMDIRMPEMDGYEAIRQIRQFNKEITIIVQTAHGLTGDKEKALTSGANDYISKPINKVELLNLMQKHIRK
jgi:PAS domain S-box-containing protein